MPQVCEVHDFRVRVLAEYPFNGAGRFVLYWMTSSRRARFNFALDRALDVSRQMNKPLLVLEPLRADYPHASERLHAFVLRGMQDNARRFREAGVTYYPYVEPRPGAARGLLEELARYACVVVGDDHPAFFLPALLRAGARLLFQRGVRFEVVDGNGLLPMRSTSRVFLTAHSFRRHLQKCVRPYLEDFPRSQPLRGYQMGAARVPSTVAKRWPAASKALLALEGLSEFPFACDTPSVAGAGGSSAAEARLRHFIRNGLVRYATDRNHLDADVASGLSPYLHFGHISAHHVFRAVVRESGWDVSRLGSVSNGSRTGFWGLGEGAEAFVDQLVTWRELGFNRCAHTRDYKHYDSLPEWARQTLAEHASDPREHCYTLEQFEAAATHDEIWNAAQRQLLRDGVIHNYLRMLWGKKVLHWSESPQVALQILLELNDKYALDGRDPNSYSGIFWIFGRYDRPWGPKRPVFGSVRYMSSDSTRRKLRLGDYLQRYGSDGPQLSLLT